MDDTGFSYFGENGTLVWSTTCGPTDGYP
ncbi:uncharacterized protein METZ01_LOCUS214176 [marine metagenome]|uniref:Uncharacterized protein n=1 Tax=marine metagenome TaxID=408172 RepID=A0A382FFB5_9ZZZZ